MVAEKQLVVDQDRILASLFDDVIIAICDIIRRPGGLVSGRMPDKEAPQACQLMFKMIECWSKPYDIHNVISRKVLKYQHQWDLEQKKTDDLNVPTVDKSNWAETMEAIVLHLKLVKPQSNSRLPQHSISQLVLWYMQDWPINALVYHIILLKIFMDTDAYVNEKQKKSMKNSWAMFFSVHKQFLDPDQMARWAAEAERKLQSSYYDGRKSGIGISMLHSTRYDCGEPCGHSYSWQLH